jgi:hypothetical protein
MIGTTPATINARFPVVILANLNKSNATRLAKLSDREWQGIYYAYARNHGGTVSDITAIVRVKAPALVTRITKFQNNAIAAWSGTSPTLKLSMKLGGTPNPILDMTLEEIYLEFRTAAMGSLSVEGAIWATADYALKNLTGAWVVGTLIGSGIHWLIETYAPSIDDKIGASMDWMMTAVANATTSTMEGYWSLQLDLQFFEVPIDQIDLAMPDLGDWGIFDDITMWLDDGYGSGMCLNPGDC